MPAKSAPRRRKTAHKGSASARQGAAAQKSSPAAVRKQRGGWLTAALIVIIVHGIFNTAALLTLRKNDYLNIPLWLYGAAVLVGLITIGSAVALWYWKRWGLYLYVAATFASMALGFVVFPSIMAAFYNIIPLGILALIMTSQRKMQLLT